MSRGDPSRQSPPRGEARARVLDVASALFRIRGFADVSMQEIADAVGITKAAMYYHFPSKEDLFAEVARRAINQFWEGIIARVEAGGSLRDTLLSITRFTVETATERVSWRLLGDIRQHLAPEVQRAIFTEHPTPEAALRDRFRRAIASGEMRPLDVDAVAMLVGALVMTLANGGHEGREPQPGDEEALVDVLLHGIAASPGDRDPGDAS